MISLKYFTITLFLGIWGFVRGEMNCTINDLTHNYLFIQDAVFDYDLETNIPYTYTLTVKRVNEASIDPIQTQNVILEWSRETETISLTVTKINEENLISKYPDYFYNFVIKLNCMDNSTVDMYTTFRIIDTNNHEPFFKASEYTYDLISAEIEDFYRLQELNPIVATDYDLTNGEVSFSIPINLGFDIEYDGIIPGTNNKNHSAKIVPKASIFASGIPYMSRIEVPITVTDVGYPPKSSTSILVINPPMPPKPVFFKPYYVGHFYYNRTFVMKENPKLEAGTTYYKTTFDMLHMNTASPSNFQAKLENDEIIIYAYWDTSDIEFYKYNYRVFTLKATYADPSLFSKSPIGSTTIIVEHHHES